MSFKKNQFRSRSLSELERSFQLQRSSPDLQLGCAPETERIRINQVIGENTVQTVVRGDFNVPEDKPAVKCVLSAEAIVKVNEVNVIMNKVIIQGVLVLQVVYVAMNKEQSVHHLHSKLPFTDFVDIQGARPGMEALAEVRVEDVKVNERPGNCPIGLRADAVLELYAKVLDTRETDIMTKAPDNVQAQTAVLNIQDVVVQNRRQCIISGEVPVPENKPAVACVLETAARVCIVSKRLIDNKVIVEGILDVSLVYVAMQPGDPVFQLHSGIRFTEFVDLPGATPDMDVQVRGFVEEVSAADIDHCADNIDVSAVVLLRAKVTEPKEITVVTSVDNYATERVLLRIEQVIGEGESQLVVKDSGPFPPDQPDIARVLDSTVTTVDINSLEILTGSVLVKGELTVQVKYVTLQPDSAVYSLERVVSFKQIVEIPGAVRGMEVTVTPHVEFATAREERCQLLLEVVLQLLVRVLDDLQQEVVSNIIQPPPCPEPEPEPEPEPSPELSPEIAGEFWPPYTEEDEYYIYKIKRGDTLYKIARLNPGVTVQDILRMNPGINADNLQIGYNLLIPKRRRT